MFLLRWRLPWTAAAQHHPVAWLGRPTAGPVLLQPAVHAALAAGVPHSTPAAAARRSAVTMDAAGKDAAAASARDSPMRVAAKDVTAALSKLLARGIDLNTTTERQIRSQLETQLGAGVLQHKKLITQHINDYLTRISSQEEPPAAAQPAGADAGADGGAGADADDFEPLAGAKRKRSPPAAAAAAASGSKRPKAARRSGSGSAGGNAGSSSGGGGGVPGIQLDTHGLRFAVVDTFRGAVRVNLRVYYRDDADDLRPTAKGISLTLEEWGAITSGNVLQQLAAALAAGNDALVLPVAGSLRATTSRFSGKLQAGVRDYYTDDAGALKPGKRGISLAPDMLDVLIGALPAIQDKIQALGGAGALAAAGSTAGAASGTAGRGAAGSAAGRGAAATAAAKSAVHAAPAVDAKAPAAATKPAAGANSSGSGAGVVELGGKKRAAVSTFTGQPCVDLREMYEAGGELRPGKKGLFLRREQWAALVGAADAITAALEARDRAYVLDIGPKRKVTISEFKGTWFVGVREHYQKDSGEWAPGQKGLNMTVQQWALLRAGMEGLTQALG